MTSIVSNQTLVITLPDGSKREFGLPVTVLEVAQSISPGLAKNTVAGKLPAWLAPVQAVVLSITEDHTAYVQDVAQLLRSAGLRAEADVRNEKIGYKIREQTLQRIPFLLVAGARERDNGTIAIRSREGEDLGTLPLDQAVAHLLAQAQTPDLSTRQAALSDLRARLATYGNTAEAKAPQEASA